MTTTTIRVAATQPAPARSKLTLLVGDGTRLVLPFAPVEAPLADLADRWVEVSRDGGRTPLLVWAGPQLSTLSFEATITDTRHPTASAERYVSALRSVARSSHPVFLLNYSTAGIGYRVVDFGASPFSRTDDGRNNVAGFTASLTLKVMSDGSPAIGPVTGGARSLAGSSSTAKTVTVAAGETATGAVIRSTGSSLRLVDVLELNGIRDPRKVAAGTVLRLPT